MNNEAIKVLEEFIEKNIKSGLRTELNAEEKQAIENIIKRNKELEEKLEKANDELIYITGQDIDEIEQFYIRKSKVREKIEELGWIE